MRKYALPVAGVLAVGAAVALLAGSIGVGAVLAVLAVAAAAAYEAPQPAACIAFVSARTVTPRPVVRDAATTPQQQYTPRSTGAAPSAAAAPYGLFDAAAQRAKATRMAAATAAARPSPTLRSRGAAAPTAAAARLPTLRREAPPLTTTDAGQGSAFGEPIATAVGHTAGVRSVAPTAAAGKRVRFG